jgi:hypothetical protein
MCDTGREKGALTHEDVFHQKGTEVPIFYVTTLTSSNCSGT